MNFHYSYKQLVAALKQVGLRKGDLVLVHSSLFAFGLLKETKGRDLPALVFKAFREVLGPRGTLVVLSTFEEYARSGKLYDCRLSPVDPLVGKFGQYVANLPRSYRTYSPLLSLAGVGPLAEEICHSWTASVCGTDSGWEKLYEHDGKICFLGVRPYQAFTFLRFVQFRFGVPYIYNKIFTAPVYEDGQLVPLQVTCPVRYLDPAYKISENLLPFEEYLNSKKLIKSRALGKGTVYAVMSSRRVFDEATKKLKENLYYFLKQPPGFVPGKIPMDGIRK